MKKSLFTVACILHLSSFSYAEVMCPDSTLIEENVATLSAAKEGKITLDGQTWNFESTLTTSDIKGVKSLNTAISDIDEHTCNYLVYPTDSNVEDASILLHQRPTQYK